MTGDRVYILTNIDRRNYLLNRVIGVFSDVDDIKSFLRDKHKNQRIQATYSGYNISFNISYDIPNDIHEDFTYHYDAEPTWINRPVK